MLLNSQTAPATERSIVLVGLMGAGKTAIGKRLAALLGLPFYDADEEIERAAGMTIAEIFKTHGEVAFRAGEKRVIQRLLGNGRIVLATGGGAFMDPETRAFIRERATSVWLRCPVPVLVQRTAGRTHRPLLNAGNPAEVLEKLSALRSPVYAMADIIVDGSEDLPHVTTANVANAIETYRAPRRVEVKLAHSSYDVLIGGGLLARAGALMAPLLPQPRCFIVTDEHVAALHLNTLMTSLDEVGIAHQSFVVKPGEASKSFASFQALMDDLLAAKIDRKTTVIAFGGGVVGDLAGFAAASAMRGVPFVQIPTSLLAQVDSSVGGKTGINSVHGKNLVGAFYQPLLVLADTGVLDTLPPRECAAGYAEIVKTGLIADADFYEWCEVHGAALVGGDKEAQASAIEHAVRFKARVVGDDERETKPNDGRALLNLGHTFAHALEAETGYGGGLLHGEAVATGLVLAAHLSASLGLAPQEDAPRIAQHLAETGLPVRIADLSAEHLLAHMKLDKKNRGGKLHFVLTRGIGRAFTSGDVPEDLVRATLLANGAV
ncbi:3-dehydroquinate synthase [Acidocella sp.]|uniref:3-dehydroquinate synthase n=1 Tax=Acidocella sp. TaxID=50710 RepID=UPI00262135AA|nr:3-dehydroquinate synthase [Acidocella sp.]